MPLASVFLDRDAPHAALHLKEESKTFLWSTWPSLKVDESHLYGFLNQCVSVKLYSRGVSLLRERETTSVLRLARSPTSSNHSPAERNRSKVDVSTPPRWWMGLTREMMDDQGGHVCFISCRMSYYGNVADPVTCGWPVSKREVSYDFGPPPTWRSQLGWVLFLFFFCFLWKWLHWFSFDIFIWLLELQRLVIDR